MTSSTTPTPTSAPTVAESTTSATSATPGPKTTWSTVAGLVVTAVFAVASASGVDIPDFLTPDAVMAQFAAATGVVTFVLMVVQYFVKDDGMAPSTQRALLDRGWTPPKVVPADQATVATWFPETQAPARVTLSEHAVEQAATINTDRRGGPPRGFHGA